MKSTGLLAIGLAVALAGCASPQLASRPLQSHEQQWSEALGRWYPGWVTPYVSPVVSLQLPQYAQDRQPSWLSASTTAATTAPVALVPVVELVPVDDQAPATYVVRKGDTLRKIAAQTLGDATLWQRIWEHNRDILREPADLQPGMVLQLAR